MNFDVGLTEPAENPKKSSMILQRFILTYFKMFMLLTDVQRHAKVQSQESIIMDVMMIMENSMLALSR